MRGVTIRFPRGSDALHAALFQFALGQNVSEVEEVQWEHCGGHWVLTMHVSDHAMVHLHRLAEQYPEFRLSWESVVADEEEIKEFVILYIFPERGEMTNRLANLAADRRYTIAFIRKAEGDRSYFVLQVGNFPDPETAAEVAAAMAQGYPQLTYHILERGWMDLSGLSVNL